MWILLIVAVLAVPVIASAQTVVGTLPNVVDGWGAIDVSVVETDGDLTTLELLVWSTTHHRHRVIAERPNVAGGYCVGPWFQASPLIGHPFTLVTAKTQRVGLRHELWVTEQGASQITRIRLETPDCAKQ